MTSPKSCAKAPIRSRIDPGVRGERDGGPHRRAEPERAVGLGVLDRVPDLVRGDRGGRDRAAAVDRLGEVHGLLPRVVVVGERAARRHLDGHALEAVAIEDLARDVGPRETARDGDLHVRGHGLLQPVLDDEAQDQRRDEEDEVERPVAHRDAKGNNGVASRPRDGRVFTRRQHGARRRSGVRQPARAAAAPLRRRRRDRVVPGRARRPVAARARDARGARAHGGARPPRPVRRRPPARDRGAREPAPSRLPRVAGGARRSGRSSPSSAGWSSSSPATSSSRTSRASRRRCATSTGCARWRRPPTRGS